MADVEHKRFEGKYYGKYEGVVLTNVDPDKQGRIKVSLPQVYGDISTEELPWKYPVSGGVWQTSSGEMAGSLNVPPNGSPVTVEFDNGDPHFPRYSAGSFGKKGHDYNAPAQVYDDNGNPNNAVLINNRGDRMYMDSRSGKEKIHAETAEGYYISISAQGVIEIYAPTHSLKATSKIIIQCDDQVEVKGNKMLVYAVGDCVVQGDSNVYINGGSSVILQGSSIYLNSGNSQSPTSSVSKIDTSQAFDKS